MSLPCPTHDRSGLRGRAHWRTDREAIAGMPHPMALLQAKARGCLEHSDWHIVRNMSATNLARPRSIGAGERRETIPEPRGPPCHTAGYRGFTNVYGRKEWDKPSPTLTGGCTTLSMGRSGHPDAGRTISVREAAILQTFRDDYRFATPYVANACNMIGNALPCQFAEAISRHCAESLHRHMV